ncbi:MULTISPECIES: hypothetical protein [unclassified Myroides]|uniref:hypothetical protein n=1 Tax=unclassified Myroides TaxID=2642485 RepID=UPI0031019D98
MKKLVAICSIFALVIGTASCNSDDNNKIRPEGNMEGTWYADQVIYSFNGDNFSRSFMELRGTDAVSETDKIVIKENKVTLFEHKIIEGKETQTTGTIDGKLMTFEKYKDNPRTIITGNDKELKLQYNFTAKEGKAPMIVSYSRVKPVFVPENK